MSYQTDAFRYDVPAGSTVRRGINNDVPGLRYGMALRMDGSSAILVSDSKYGYRGQKESLNLTLINSSVSPDPYPERGIHTITLWVGAASGDAKEAEDIATGCNHKIFYQPTNCHHGELPLEDSLVSVASDSAVITAVQPTTDGCVLVRGCETSGERSAVKLSFGTEVKEAQAVDLFEETKDNAVETDGSTVTVEVDGNALFAVKVRL